MKYFDVFGEGGFHSAFMTTFAFGTLAFEDIPFPKLKGAGCRNITVLADREMVNQAFADYGPPLFAGTSYHLVKAHAPTAFHPKITLLIGETKGRLLVGSANLTALGLGGNKEQVASISYSTDEPNNAKFFSAALDYVARYVPEDDLWFPESRKRALRSAPWLRDAVYSQTFKGDDETALNFLCDRPEITLLDQIIASVGSDTIERLVVLSPYWDTKLEGVARLKAGLGIPPTDLLIENDNGGFPSSELARFSDVALFDASPSSPKRFLHAKLIIAQGCQWDHVISGSMNCTFPALMGPGFGGNAEAAIYKRVPRGAALDALGLTGYTSFPMHRDQLDRLQESFVEPEKLKPTIDGGALILRGGKIFWSPPAKVTAEPLSVELFDRNGASLSQLQVNERQSSSLAVAPDTARPKYGVLHFLDGSMSAPIQVADIDVLTVMTLPPHRGAKKRWADMLAEKGYEDLSIIESLNALEDAESADRAGESINEPKLRSSQLKAEEREYRVLSYEEFIRARTLANEQGEPFGLYLHSREDAAANLVSACLNRLIGLVGPDLRGDEDSEFQSVGKIDFRTSEPQSINDDQDADSETHERNQRRAAASQSLATAKKFQEAVTAFEIRSKSLADKQITTSEMVRLRALMQIILSHAQPVAGTAAPSQILPVYNAQGHDWPRLIGRLLLRHFGATRVLQNLSVENDESEQQRVLEYLALSNYAAKAAYSAAASEKKAAVVKGSLERVIASLTSQTQAIIAITEGDKAYFDEMTARLHERFESRLGLSTKVSA
ncbi:hypothetical protein [Brucella anthropi]|uniref:hypothetical protein n=1 Tax=Brucella anthropi TaxID=529 RepID=UPI0024470EA9|nr:hypothetical protein [Brucella anthropi]MDH0369683.1 hypothetical protein [Brucella anthropi]